MVLAYAGRQDPAKLDAEAVLTLRLKAKLIDVVCKQIENAVGGPCRLIEASDFRCRTTRKTW